MEVKFLSYRGNDSDTPADIIDVVRNAQIPAMAQLFAIIVIAVTAMAFLLAGEIGIPKSKCDREFSRIIRRFLRRVLPINLELF